MFVAFLGVKLKNLWWVQVKKFFCNSCSDGFGSENFDLGRVGSAIYGLGLNLEIFPKKCQIFQFFPFRSKKSVRVVSESTRVEGGPAFYLLRVKSKLVLGRVRAHL